MFLNTDVKNRIAAMLSWDIMKNALAEGQIPLVQLHALAAFMTQNGIAYDISFSPGNGRNAPGIELTIFISPSVKLLFEIDLGPGPTSFTQ